VRSKIFKNSAFPSPIFLFPAISLLANIYLVRQSLEKVVWRHFRKYPLKVGDPLSSYWAPVFLFGWLSEWQWKMHEKKLPMSSHIMHQAFCIQYPRCIAVLVKFIYMKIGKSTENLEPL
jgi:hypothetical protein